MDPLELTSPEFWHSQNPVVFAPPHLKQGGQRVRRFLLGQAWASGAVVFATSGSTGKPKWVVHTRESLLISAAMVNRHLEVTEPDHWLLALPHFHVGGFGVLARAHQAGCRSSVFEQKWNASNFASAINESGATLTSLVPTQVHDLAKNSVKAPDCLRAVVVGGGSLTESYRRQMRELGWPVLQSYGMTEAGSQIATESLSQLEKDSPASFLAILDGWELRTSRGGVLEIRGTALCRGILREEEDDFFYDHFSIGEWFVTNDLVDLTDNGISFLRRCGDEIKVRGELVDLGELESRLIERTKGVGDGVLVALEDERVGYRLYPVFESEEKESGKLESVIIALNDELPKFCQLEKPFKLAKLPQTELGKIDMSRLKELLSE